MRTIKVIIGLGFMIAAFFTGALTFMAFTYCQNAWMPCASVILTLGSAGMGAFLIAKQRSPLSKQTIILVALTASVLIASPLLLDLHIRQERRLLQMRAKEFLSRPVPNIFDTNFIGGYFESRNGNVLVRSRSLIERYASKGRIRWSARIQGQFATAPFGISACEEVAGTNEEARIYLSRCKAILDEEWRMGFWQWVEDTIEMKETIPEHEEENVKPATSMNQASQQQ